jgi:hypothetical protein
MPRAKYPLLRERMMEFAKGKKNVPGSYHDSGEWEILKMNWELLYKRVVEADAVPGSPPTKEHIGQKGAIRDTASPHWSCCGNCYCCLPKD